MSARSILLFQTTSWVGMPSSQKSVSNARYVVLAMQAAPAPMHACSCPEHKPPYFTP